MNYHSQVLALRLDEAVAPRLTIEEKVRSLGYGVRPVEALQVIGPTGADSQFVEAKEMPWWQGVAIPVRRLPVFSGKFAIFTVPLVRLFWSCHIFVMIRRVSRYILIVLLAFTFSGGTFVQAESAVPSVQCQAMMHLNNCSPAQTLHVAGVLDHQKTPVQPTSPNCIDQMACVSMPMLSAQLTGDSYTVGYSKTIYSRSNSSSEGLSLRPAVFPPIVA